MHRPSITRPATWIPLDTLTDEDTKFWVYDSLLSEYAALGYEYGTHRQALQHLLVGGAVW